MKKIITTMLLSLSFTTAAEPTSIQIISDAIASNYRDVDRTDGPGCAVGYARNGKLLYQKGFGLANLEHDIPITPNTVFRIASTSKQFVAVSLALLAQQGRLDLDADIHTVLPDLPDYGATVTLRQMITHSSGIPNIYKVMDAVYGNADGNFYPGEKTLEYLYRMKRLDFEPGTQYAYSNSAYLLLAQAVEALSGQTLRQFAHENIFAPLGMNNTHFHDNHRELIKGRADGYLKLDGRWTKNNTNFEVMGDGGVFSTLENLVIWYHNFADNRLPGGDKLLHTLMTPATYSEVPAKYRNWSIDYAFGNMFLTFGGKTLFGHAGGFVGFVSAPYRIQETNEIMVSLCNYHAKGNVNRVFETVELIYGDKQ